METVAPLLVLIHSPNLGPASWRPVADELSRAGRKVVVPSLAGFTAGDAPYVRRLVRLAAGQVRAGPSDDVILVPHSGAGVFVPYLARAVAAREVTAVFADAALPRRPAGSTVVEDEFLPFLRERANGGIVLPWPQWWPGEDLAPLFPDEATRQAVTSEAAALPLRFFEETLPAMPDGWPLCRAAYLVFSEPYRREADEAARAGWPVRELPGGHLHMLVNPGAVAAAITSLAAEARAAGSSLSSLP
jgi:pimeloyl-ACP methyl ester carboxylesterase